jgi:hypothetical protein
MIGRMRPSIVVGLACSVTGLVLTGCGGGSGHITKARAVAYARAVNLRRSDVPGMASFGGLEANGEVVNFQLTPAPGCGSADSGEEFDVYSPMFRRLGKGQGARVGGGYLSLPAEGVHSKVAVKQSTAEDERDFSALVCGNAHFEATRHTPRHRGLPSPLSGVRVLGVRTWTIAQRATFGTANVSVYNDRFSFVVGPAEVELAVTSAPGPPRAELERHLLSLLYGRAEAHKL